MEFRKKKNTIRTKIGKSSTQLRKYFSKKKNFLCIENAKRIVYYFRITLRNKKKIKLNSKTNIQKTKFFVFRNMETLIHLLKGSLGTGILAMPNAFSNSGWLVGIIGTLLIGLLCTYCIHVLIKAELELCRRRRVPSLTYPQVAEEALKEGPNWCKAIAPYSG